MTKKEGLQQAYDLAAANAGKMRQMHDKLVKDITELNARKDAIKAFLLYIPLNFFYI